MDDDRYGCNVQYEAARLLDKLSGMKGYGVTCKTHDNLVELIVQAAYIRVKDMEAIKDAK